MWTRGVLWVTLFLNMASPMRAVEYTNPNVHKDYSTIPAMDMRRPWNGIPFNDFIEEFFTPLINGLGSIQEKGYTLYQTALRMDPGGLNPRAVVPFIATTPQQRSENRIRMERLFSCVMNYVSSKTWVYRHIMANYQNRCVSLRWTGIISPLSL